MKSADIVIIGAGIVGAATAYRLIQMFPNSREGYGKFDVNLTELSDLLKHKGFWKLLAKQKASVFNEFKSSLFVKSYLRNIQKYCPNIGLSDLRPFRCGIRPLPRL